MWNKSVKNETPMSDCIYRITIYAVPSSRARGFLAESKGSALLGSIQYEMDSLTKFAC